jgi:hypothetical protein
VQDEFHVTQRRYVLSHFSSPSNQEAWPRAPPNLLC